MVCDGNKICFSEQDFTILFGYLDDARRWIRDTVILCEPTGQE